MVHYDVLLIKPYSELSNVLPPVGLGYLSSALKKIGFSTKVIHCYKDSIDISGIISFIKNDHIKIVGITCCSNDHFWLQRFAKKLELFPDVYLIVGGPHATGLSKRLIYLIPRINFIIRSEGEYCFPKLVQQIKNNNLVDSALKNIPNLVWRNSSGELVENLIELPNDLDALGLPDWDQLAPREYASFPPHGGFAKTPPVAQLITTRGCPYTCRYCASYIMNGKNIRMRSPESIVKEIEYLIKNHGVKEIHIEDDNFTFYKDHVINVCTAIRKSRIKLNFGLPNGVRVDRLDNELLKELRNTGFYFLSIGIESGSPTTLKRMKKALTIEKIKEGIALIRKYNFRIKGFFVIGYPGETRKDIIKTIQFAKSLDLDQAFFSIYIPIPGTEEFKQLEEEGYIDITKSNWENYYTGKFSVPPYVPDGMTANELKNLVSTAFRSFYFRPKIFLRLLKDLTAISQIKHIIRRGALLIK